MEFVCPLVCQKLISKVIVLCHHFSLYLTMTNLDHMLHEQSLSCLKFAVKQ